MTNQIEHLESLKDDIRDEIKRRIEQRDKYSLQLVISLATILAVFSVSNIGQTNIDFRKVIIVAPLISIYFSVLILYSYRIHYILTKYLREKIEPKLAELHKISRDYEWENFYRIYSVPGIRKIFFLLMPLLISAFSLLYLWLIYHSELWPWLIFITLVYSSFIIYILYEFWIKEKPLKKLSLVRDLPRIAYPKHYRGVFIDRDGTINVDTHYTHKIKELELLPSVEEGFKELSELPLDIIVVSNQAGIALGYFTQNKMSKFNKKLRNKITKKGGRIDAFYFCPHLEPKHLGLNETPSDCSKPASGMLFEAAKDFDFDLEKSYLIGNKLTDTEAGNQVGCKTILIEKDKSIKKKYNKKNKPYRRVDNFIDAVKIVKKEFENHSL